MFSLEIAPAVASDPVSDPSLQFSGIISGWGGLGQSNSTDAALDQDSLYGFGGEARISAFDPSGFGIQLDARGELLYEFPLENSAIFETGAHLIYSDMENFAVGAFGGLGYSEMPADNSDVTYIMYGLEGAYYAGAFKLVGQAGLTNFIATNDSNSDLFRDAWFARTGAGYSFNESTALSGDLTYTAGTTETQFDPDDGYGLTWNLELERQITSNASGFVAYSGSYFTNIDNDTNYSDNIFKLGFKFRLGANSIQQSEKYVPFDLPNVGRAYAVSEEVD
ncbi:MAG: hypothetical protein AAFR39_00850 [Pseudomonadota bacterium]